MATGKRIKGTSLFFWVVLSLLGRLQAAAPVVSGLPTTVYVGENETGQRLLYTYTIADPNGNSYTCSKDITGTPGTPVGDEFNIILNTGTGKYELWTTAAGSTSFDPTTISDYNVAITCTDSNGEVSAPLNVQVVVKANSVVTINNVEGSANDVTLAALSTGAAITVKTVDATSNLGHTLSYSLTSSPSYSPEFFTIDSSTGAIKTNRELKYIDASVSTIYLTVAARDVTDQIKVYATQTIHLTNQNTIPTTTNMPLTASKLESLAAGTTLFKVSVSDPDSSQTHTYRYTCSPATGEDTFTLDASGNFKIATGMSMDYESITFYNCSFYVSDGIHEGGPFLYELTVLNDNDAPKFSETMHYATVSEGAQSSVSFTPGFTCTDADAGDVTTFDLQNVNNSDRFSIDSSGVMTFNTNYDVDNNMPTSVVLTVYCIDSGGTDGNKKTGSTQVTITITDVNDNTPNFPATTYSFSVNQYTSPGAVIGTLTPTDADSGSNADLTCSGVSTSAYGSYYTVGSNCNVYLTKTIDFDYGTHTGYTAYAKDNGSPQLTGTTAIDIVYSEATTTTVSTTTTASYNFWDHGENIAMFVMTLLAGLALLGLLSYCLSRMCCGGGCGGGQGCFQQNHVRRRYPPRQITPESPPRRKRRPRTPSPIYREATPPPPKPTRVIQTIARPAPPPYIDGIPGYYRNPYPLPRPVGGGLIRTAPALPGLYR